VEEAGGEKGKGKEKEKEKEKRSETEAREVDDKAGGYRQEGGEVRRV